ncbi:MAG: adenylyltransferase/cytidyltransferase family protein [Bdellovibrionales bacterium]|nr:adenylyltransferase/cytidyltransferase family protein [Bdellovibrionales bacterium]
MEKEQHHKTERRGRAGDKILGLEALTEALEAEKAHGKKIVQCHGVFDLLHPGHIRHLAEAKTLGDILVVSLTKDQHVNKGPGRPAFNIHLRAESIAALQCVDYVTISDFPTAVEMISALRPDVYVKGADYEEKGKDLTKGIYAEEEAVRRAGGILHFTHDITFSSTEILNKNFGVYPEHARQYLRHFRNQYRPDDIIDQLKALKDLKVLVLGDTIVDEYHYCQPLGKSPKETIVSTRYLSEEGFAGGILACANHIAAFSDHVDLITILGSKDPKTQFIESQLNSKIRNRFFYREDACTNIKRRFVEPAFLTKMFQVSFLTDTDLSEPLTEEIICLLEETLPNYDVVVVADYGHGFLNQDIIGTLGEKAPYLALNVQTNSANQGYNLVTKYPQADYISIDEPELRLAMQQKYTPVHDLIEQFARRYPETTITITRGHNGSITRTPKGDLFEALSVSSKIVDRVGAGDAYFAVTSLLAARGAGPEVIGFVGNAVGAMAVEIVCNRSSVQAVPVFKFVKSLLS